MSGKVEIIHHAVGSAIVATAQFTPRANAWYKPVSEDAVLGILPDAILVKTPTRWEVRNGEYLIGRSTCSGRMAWVSAAMSIRANKSWKPWKKSEAIS